MQYVYWLLGCPVGFQFLTKISHNLQNHKHQDRLLFHITLHSHYLLILHVVLQVILASLEQGVREGRMLLHDWLVILIAQYNDAYKLLQYRNGSSTTAHVDVAFSQCPQLQPLPRLVFALLRNPLLRFHEEGVHPDYRIYLQCLFRYLVIMFEWLCLGIIIQCFQVIKKMLCIESFAKVRLEYEVVDKLRSNLRQGWGFVRKLNIIKPKWFCSFWYVITLAHLLVREH